MIQILFLGSTAHLQGLFSPLLKWWVTYIEQAKDTVMYGFIRTIPHFKTNDVKQRADMHSDPPSQHPISMFC